VRISGPFLHALGGSQGSHDDVLVPRAAAKVARLANLNLARVGILRTIDRAPEALLKMPKEERMSG
jgi:hypothetical protein